MLKVVVFDYGWGGELFAKYLDENIGVLEIIKEIDWLHGDYLKYGKKKICELIENALAKHIGCVDLIVVTSYLATNYALDYLKEKYPKQKFAGAEYFMENKFRNDSAALSDYEYELREYKKSLNLKQRIKFLSYGIGVHGGVFCRVKKEESVLVLCSSAVKRSQKYKKQMKTLDKHYHVIDPNCDEMITSLNEGREVGSSMIFDVAYRNDVKAILICDNSLLRLKDMFTNIFGWRVRVLDDFDVLAKDVCLALQIRNVKLPEERKILMV